MELDERHVANRILTVRGEKKTEREENCYVVELSSYVAAFRLAVPWENVRARGEKFDIVIASQLLMRHRRHGVEESGARGRRILLCHPAAPITC